jgi:peptidoglycan-N-acetylglucosamine deacetylase
MDPTRDWEYSVLEPARQRRRDWQRARARRRAIRRLAVVLAACLVGAGAYAVANLSSSHASQHRRAAGRSRGRRSGAAGVVVPAPALRPKLLEARENRAIDRALAYTPFVRAGGRRRREVALTFDDGPGPYTPAVIRILRRMRAPGTFFEIGFMERWFHASTRHLVRDGFPIGDHTQTHPKMGFLSAPAQRAQILDQAAAIRRQGAPRPRLFRPPYGSFNRATLRTLRRMRMLMVLWTIDTSDYARIGPKAIVQRAVGGARPGAIILLHDAGGDRSQTVAALPYIVRKLRRRHYRLVTVPRLLLDDPPPRGEKLPSGLSGD